MSRQLAEWPKTIALGPDKSVQKVTVRIARGAGKPDDIASLIDCRRRIPELSPEVADVGHLAVFPKHSVPGSMSSYRLVADARNAHGLTPVIDRRGGSGSVDGNQRESVDLVSIVPDGWAKLKDLGRDAGRVMNTILRPPDHL